MNELQPRIEAHVWRVASVVIVGSIMSILDTTIVNVALERLGIELHTTLADIQWVITGYLLSLAAVIPVTGWAARRFGARRVYLVSIVLFTAGSALCGFATSATELIVFRVIQGIGGGMILPVGQLMMARAAGPQRMGRVMGIITVPAMLAPILGPTLGGLILDNASWRWIFFVNVPVGVAAVVAAIKILPQDEPEVAGPFDLLGLTLLALGLPLITYGLAEIGATGGFSGPKVIVPLLSGVLATALFVFHALRATRPLLDLRLYKRGTFSSASFAMFCLGGALFGGMILMPLYWQQIRHEDVVQTGLLTAPMGIGMALVMPIAGKLSDRYGGGPLALAGVLLTTIATVPFGFIGAHTSIIALSAVMVIRGVGVGFAFMPAMSAAFASLQPSELSDATPQLNMVQRVGGSIGTAILAVVLQRSLDGSHTLAARASAYGDAFWWSAGITAIAIIPCVVLVRAERKAKAARSAGTRLKPDVLAEALAEAVA